MIIPDNRDDGLPPAQSQYLYLLRSIATSLANSFGGSVDDVPDQSLKGVVPKDQKFLNALLEIKQAIDTATGGGGGGTTDHRQLSNRDAADQHPISAVAGLASALSDEAAARETADNTKVDKVSGKGLSTNDYTNTDKTRVAGAIQSSEKGAADGVATLGDDGKVPSEQLPSITGGVQSVSGDMVNDTDPFNVTVEHDTQKQDALSQTQLDNIADVPNKASQADLGTEVSNRALGDNETLTAANSYTDSQVSTVASNLTQEISDRKVTDVASITVSEQAGQNVIQFKNSLNQPTDIETGMTDTAIAALVATRMPPAPTDGNPYAGTGSAWVGISADIRAASVTETPITPIVDTDTTITIAPADWADADTFEVLSDGAQAHIEKGTYAEPRMGIDESLNAVKFTTSSAGVVTKTKTQLATQAAVDALKTYPAMTIAAADYFTEVKAKFVALGGGNGKAMDIAVLNQAGFTPTGNSYFMNFYLNAAGDTFYIVATRVDGGDRYATTYNSTTEKPVWKPIDGFLVSTVPANQYIKLGMVADFTAASARCGFRITSTMNASGSNTLAASSESVATITLTLTAGAITAHLMSISAATTNTTRSTGANVWSALSLIVTTAGDILLQNLGNAALAFSIETLYFANVKGTDKPVLVAALTDAVYGQCWGGGSGNLDETERLTGRLFNGQPTYMRTYTGAHGIDDENIVFDQNQGDNNWIEYTKVPLLSAVEFTVIGDKIQIELSSATASGTPAITDFAIVGAEAGTTITAVDIALGVITLTLSQRQTYNNTMTVAYTQGANKITTPLGGTLASIAATYLWNLTPPVTAPLTLNTSQGTGYLMLEDVYGGNDIYMLYVNKGSGTWTNRMDAVKVLSFTGISDGRVLAGNGNVLNRSQTQTEGNLTPTDNTNDRFMLSRKEAQNLGTEEGISFNWTNYPSNNPANNMNPLRYRGIRGLGNIWTGTTSNTGTGHYYFSNTAFTSGNGGSCGMVPCFAVVHQS
ncbi:MAG: hypothetical protein Ta2A_11050 [Treponemataceae bacterium]|nr:MAG: hypothetical protein Ta2A_11050 [Treponemataceae bacterium]